ncbi:MAG: bifunctional UDP-N-acetylmuramoyl-tripeptide:D-alanyl-D-alanine ligase/alanine racemase, partial [Bacteroidetes bacterium]|nr:bifunctional UDP-N-acetylmuramoyl-tripeptide:D-alanyl-D-alanine ligase/alanine racemase [Bacteroidota bacterium]
MAFSFTPLEFAEITQGKWLYGLMPEGNLHFVFTDSRNFYQKNGAVFFAITGERFDGHKFCKDLAALGQNVFVVSKEQKLPEGACQLLVDDTLRALQSLAAAHRKKFKGEVIGITGSNGKTIVKEWLYELLSTRFNTYKSPKSFNSQIGVALAILNADINYQYYIIEAGISQENEMSKLAQIIAPDLGIFTFLGNAHSEGFDSDEEKFLEKCKLFEHARKVFFYDQIKFINKFPYSSDIVRVGNDFSSDYLFGFYEFSFTVKTLTKVWVFDYTNKDAITRQNMSLALAAALDLGVNQDKIKSKISHLQTPSMRLELLEGLNNSTIVNDTWTNDPDALSVAVDFLLQQKKQTETCLILSDYPDETREDAYLKAAELIARKRFTLFVGIGKHWMLNQKLIKDAEQALFFESTEDFLKQIDLKYFANKAILIKGSRRFRLELIANRLQQKTHETVLEINLDNLAYNFHLLKNRLKPETKVMAMVKAFAYGSGNYEVARLLEHHRVDYMAVAYIDEGLALRNSGVKTPILILNPELQDIEKYIENDLEPSIGSFYQLNAFIQSGLPVKIHLELDTGMHRLGFQWFEKEELLTQLKSAHNLIIQGIFTHLAASDEKEKDSFTQKQIEAFKNFSLFITQETSTTPVLHVSNSTGAIRFAEAGGDMVRLGIGLYGIDPSDTIQNSLKNVFTFKTHITQIKSIAAGEGVGYGFHSVENTERKIAIIEVGYADGFNRKFSRHNHCVLINGQKAPVIGNVCMDMTMVDVTQVQCEEGDEVILFGEALPVSIWADKLQTIPYEILTSVS